MKTKFSFLIILLNVGVSILFAQKQNNNWINDKATWNFNNTSSGDFLSSSNTSDYMAQGVSAASDKTTGDLLFYTNGINVYNKNYTLMTNGADLFETTLPGYSDFGYNLFLYGGPFSAQGSLIIPVPNSNSKYYVFSLSGNAKNNCEICFHNEYKYGLRYAKVDTSANGGLGQVTTKNNIIFSNTNTNVMTSSPSSDGNFWLITQNDAGNYLSYKVTASGISAPIVSSQAFDIATTGIKVSPNNAMLFDISGRNLYNFNNTTGAVSFIKRIVPQYSYSAPALPCSADFSEDSNVIYFVSLYATLGTGKSSEGYYLSKYVISTDQVYGFDNIFGYPIKPIPASSLQRHTNGKIYLKTYGKVKFSNTNYYNYDRLGSWYRFTNPNSTALDFSNFETILTNPSMNSGYTFPQLIGTQSAVNPCPDVLNINTPVTASQDFQASQQIIANSVINDNLNVNYKAGTSVTLLPGFYTTGNATGNFKAYITPCIISNLSKDNAENISAISSKEVTRSLDVKIYPNPASDILYVKSVSKINGVEVFDMSGKKINVLLSNDQINVRNLPAGAYIINIETKDGKSTKKFIKK